MSFRIYRPRTWGNRPSGMWCLACRMASDSWVWNHHAASRNGGARFTLWLLLISLVTHSTQLLVFVKPTNISDRQNISRDTADFYRQDLGSITVCILCGTCGGKFGLGAEIFHSFTAFSCKYLFRTPLWQTMNVTYNFLLCYWGNAHSLQTSGFILQIVPNKMHRYFSIQF